MDIMLGLEEGSYSESDIKKLADSGATEFFCGIMPADWVSLYGFQISLNKREWQANQFLSFEKLNIAIQRAHQAGIRVAVAMNAHYYIDKQIPMVVAYLKTLADIGSDALIVGNLPLLLLIKKIGLNIPIYISGEYGTYSTRAVEAIIKYGVKRILFPRDMSLLEIEKIIKNTKKYGLEYEAFILSEKCVFSTGYCRATHGYLPSNFCHHHWSKGLYARFLSEEAPKNPKVQMEEVPVPLLDTVVKWNNNAALYKAFTNCNFYHSSKPIDTCWGGCGLCAVSKLKEAGVTSLKVVSRGTSLSSKIVKLKILSDVLKGLTVEQIKKYRNSPEICDIGYACYYREAGRADG